MLTQQDERGAAALAAEAVDHRQGARAFPGEGLPHGQHAQHGPGRGVPSEEGQCGMRGLFSEKELTREQSTVDLFFRTVESLRSIQYVIDLQ